MPLVFVLILFHLQKPNSTYCRITVRKKNIEIMKVEIETYRRYLCNATQTGVLSAKEELLVKSRVAGGMDGTEV